MRIKRLDNPFWDPFWCSDDERMELEGFNTCLPIFKRDGFYLINNFIVVVEEDGKAWISFSSRLVDYFKHQLNDANHNKLSSEIINAMKVLDRNGLLSKEQRELKERDYWIAHTNQLYYYSMLKDRHTLGATAS